MTIRELIELLEEFPADMQVVVSDDSLYRDPEPKEDEECEPVAVVL